MCNHFKIKVHPLLTTFDFCNKKVRIGQLIGIVEN
jgi:hypothetical protein